MSDPDWMLMHRHGTLPYIPTVNVLIQAAESALINKREAAVIRQMRGAAKRDGASARYAGKTKRSAWLSKHVRNANTASELLYAAWKGFRDAQNSRDKETAILYRSEDRLEEAYKEAWRREQSVAHQHIGAGAGSGAPHGVGSPPCRWG